MSILQKSIATLIATIALIATSILGGASANAAPQPTGLTATPISGGLLVSWTDVGSYRTEISFSENTNSGWGYGTGTCGVPVLSPSDSCTITGLDPQKSYYISAISSDDDWGHGQSGWTSEVGPFTPLALPTPPPAPTGLGWQGPENGSLTLIWSEPQHSVPVTGHEVTISTAENGTYQVVSNGTCASAGNSIDRNCTVTGLTNGEYYWVKVAAKNEAGTGAASEPLSVRPGVAPSAVTSLTGIAHPSSLTIAWLAPTNSGSAAIEKYRISIAAAGGDEPSPVTEGPCSGFLSALVTTCELTGLTRAQSYLVVIRAYNLHGANRDSQEFALTTSTSDVPGRPSYLKAKSYSKKLTLSWRAPAASLAEIPLGYTVQISTNKRTWKSAPSGTCRTASPTSRALSCTITGLKARSYYWVRVASKNSIGTSSYLTPIRYKTK